MDGTVVQSLPSRQSGQYWDAAATNWEEEIFSSFHNDRKGVILAALKAAADGKAAMADFGCGVGIYLPVLGRLFGEVHGFEQSAACVDVARRKTRGQGNISVHVASSALKSWRGRFDAVLCANAAIHPRRAIWQGVLDSARALLRDDGGKLILVVPALGSARLLAKAERNAAEPRIIVKPDQPNGDSGVSIDGVSTKHFTAAELKRELAARGFRAIRVQRVEYSWACHSIRPPKALSAAKPWDWLVTARAA
jgi:SAM-dependent methyltransferase